MVESKWGYGVDQGINGPSPVQKKPITVVLSDEDRDLLKQIIARLPEPAIENGSHVRLTEDEQ